MVTEQPAVDEELGAVVAEAIAEMETEARNNVDLQSDVKAALDRSQTLTQKSMVRSNGVSLPERIRFYRSRGGAEAWLPTAQLAYHLRKRHNDGSPVFVRERLEPLPGFIKEQCDICVRTAGKPKMFRHRFDYVSHMESKHPREYRMQKEDEEKLRGPELASVLMAMSPSERAAIRSLIGGDDNAGKQEGDKSTAQCGDCGWEGKPVSNTDASLATHKRLHCQAVPAGSGASPAQD